MRDFGGAPSRRSVSVAAVDLIAELVLGLRYLAFRWQVPSKLTVVSSSAGILR